MQPLRRYATRHGRKSTNAGKDRASFPFVSFPFFRRRGTVTNSPGQPAHDLSSAGKPAIYVVLFACRKSHHDSLYFHGNWSNHVPKRDWLLIAFFDACGARLPPERYATTLLTYPCQRGKGRAVPRQACLGYGSGLGPLTHKKLGDFRYWRNLTIYPAFLVLLQINTPSEKDAEHAHHTRRSRPAQATYPLPAHQQGGQISAGACGLPRRPSGCRCPAERVQVSSPTYLTPNLRKRPTWLLGASGSGKTNLLMVVLHTVLGEVAAANAHWSFSTSEAICSTA